MRITNGSAFIDGDFARRDVYIEDGKFSPGAGGETIDAKGCYVVPGLVDIHTHGAVGYDFCSPDRSHFGTITEYYLKNGVTSVLCASMTMDAAQIEQVFKALRGYNNERGARVMGIYMEGPFFSAGKRGAQPEQHLRLPDIGLLQRLNDASGGIIRIVCLAPELPGAVDFIKAAAGVCKVSLAHTEATYSEAMAGFEAGAGHVTHLFNAMSGFQHREPGVFGAAADAGAYVELICDGYHLHPSVIRTVFKLFGSRKVCLVSDSLACAGLEDGEYNLAGQAVTVHGGKATLAGGVIAGSSINMLDALRNAVSYGIALTDAVMACTQTPALSAGIGHLTGAIKDGLPGDCLVLEEDLSLRHVIKGGALAHTN